MIGKNTLWFHYCVVVAIGCSNPPTNPHDFNPGEPPPAPRQKPIIDSIDWKPITTTSVDFRFWGASPRIAFDPSGTLGFARGSSPSWMRTTDGGKTWMGPEEGGLNIKVLSKEVTYRWWPLAKSTDSGVTWNWLQLPDADAQVLVVRSGDIAAWKTTAPTIWRTTDDGLGWLRVDLSGNVRSVASFDGSRFASAANGKLHISIDGRLTWQERPFVDATTPEAEWAFDAIWFSDAQTLVSTAQSKDSVARANGYIRRGVFRSLDGGISWSEVHVRNMGWSTYQTPYPTNTVGYSFIDPRSWIILIVHKGSSGMEVAYVFISDDEGNSCTDLPNLGYLSGFFNMYYKPAFAPPNWKVGLAGRYMTRDGGKTSSEQKEWAPFYTSAAYFLNPYEVIALYNFTIYRGTAP
ncbi:MAG: hypothetical protein FJ217_16660 [Ignavibacteria bacterium]|nr:hypothetical protein [Deltaproteobacteria bacterium]MBM4162712.1 hypothetical protein [Ignavibacteria bacterium]